MNPTKLKQYKWGGFILCLLFAASVHLFQISRPLDRILLDRQFQLLRNFKPQPIADDVVIVGIDEATYEAFPEPFALWHPHIGKLLKALAQGKSALVGLDIVLPERSYNFLVPGYDLPLLQGLTQLREQSTVLLGRSVDGKGTFRRVFPPYVSISGSTSLPSVMICLDDDGVARRFEENLCADNTKVKTLAGEMAELKGFKGRGVKGLIDYSIGEPFSYIPMLDIVSWFDEGNSTKLEQVFSGKTVLIGVVMPYTDRISYPVPIAAWEQSNTKLPGILWHAQAFRSMKFHGLIQEVSRAVIITLGLAAVIFWFGQLSWIKAVLFGAFISGILACSLFLLSQGLHFPVGAILLSASMAFIVRATYEAVLQMRERQLLRGTFGNYVSPQILQEIIAGNIKPGLGGERKRVCVLFSDIRGFTTRSEHLPPEDVIKMLNGYFTEMTAAVHRHGGTVDKFIGDGMMAFFGAPQSLECPEKNAFDAAREMLIRLERYNSKLRALGLEPIQIGIGIHVGEVIIGHVGSETRNEYTAIGDVVNTASRLESITKSLGCSIICSAEVAHLVKNSSELVDLGEQPLKGRSPVKVYGYNPKYTADMAREPV